MWAQTQHHNNDKSERMNEREREREVDERNKRHNIIMSLNPSHHSQLLHSHPCFVSSAPAINNKQTKISELSLSLKYIHTSTYIYIYIRWRRHVLLGPWHCWCWCWPRCCWRSWLRAPALSPSASSVPCVRNCCRMWGRTSAAASAHRGGNGRRAHAPKCVVRIRVFV